MGELMDKIRFFNIADVDCWIVYIMPFNDEEKGDLELVNRVQRCCIQDNYFGMGWDLEDAYSFEEEISKDKAEEYKKKYIEKYDGVYSVSDSAISAYVRIKKGDYVIARLKDSNYYVGRVASERAVWMNKPGDENYKYFSWGCKVEKWVKFSNPDMVPSEIVGRFSQRLHSTIQRIDTYRLRLLVMALYESGIEETERIWNVPKLRINGYNFVSSLHDKELENLMALFMYELHSGYILLPSSCKVSEPKYEFRFVLRNAKPITCQVKNKRWVYPELYEGDDSYEKIYLFSGLWTEDDIQMFREKYNGKRNIYIVSKQELYDTLKKEGMFYNPFYDFENSPVSTRDFNLEGYCCMDKLGRRSKDYKNYTINDNFICFYQGDGLFYSAEFDALVLSWHILGNSEEAKKEEQESAEKILQDLNRGR